jgi:hypothetical protein
VSGRLAGASWYAQAAALAAGAHALGALTLDGLLAFSTSPTQQTVVIGTTIVPTHTIMRITASTNFTLTSTPHVSPGVDGQLLILWFVSGAGAVGFQDAAFYAGSLMVNPGNGTVSLAYRDLAGYIYSAQLGLWVTIAPKVNM